MFSANTFIVCGYSGAQARIINTLINGPIGLAALLSAALGQSDRTGITANVFKIQTMQYPIHCFAYLYAPLL